METVNPYSTEIRYALDMMGYLLHRHRPASVRIHSDSTEMVQAIIRRLAVDGYRLFVDSEEICSRIQASLSIEVEVAGGELAEAALYPLSLDKTAVPQERVIVAAWRNVMSYKSLVHPGAARTLALGALARARRDYDVDSVIGMYPPRFVALLAFAYLVGRWNSSTYFQFYDLAMRHLYTFGPMWRLSYVVLFAGQRKSDRSL